MIKKVIALLLIVFIVSGILVVKNNDLNMKDPSDVLTFMKEYAKWSGNTIRNVAILTAHVVKMDWLPQS